VGELNGGKRASALAIYRDTGNREWESGCQDPHTTQGKPLFTDLIYGAVDDIFHEGGIEIYPADNFIEHGAEKFRSGPVAKIPVLTAYRRSYCANDKNIIHNPPPLALILNRIN
jgi:hypothetical protein